MITNNRKLHAKFLDKFGKKKKKMVVKKCFQNKEVENSKLQLF